MSETIMQALQLMGLGMGGIFIVMTLLYACSQLLLKLTKPKDDGQ